MRHPQKQAILVAATLWFAAFACTLRAAPEEKYLYRYVNSDGVKVITHTVPPEYAQNGYEVLSANGQVLKKVERAPSADELAEADAKRLLNEQYQELRRRYSSVEDIEAAKARRLQNLSSNIAILRGNISNLNTQIENLMNNAAEEERQGRAVPASLLQQISDVRAELDVTKEVLQLRLDEYNAVTSRFDQDVVIFTKGAAFNQATD